MTISFTQASAVWPSRRSGSSLTGQTASQSPSIPSFMPAATADDDLLASPSSTNEAVPSMATAPPFASLVAAGIPGQNGDPPLKVATSGSGLVFLNTFTSNDTQAYENCVVAAERQLEGLFTNDVTLRMTFDMIDVKGGDVDGNVYTDGFLCSYADLKAALLKLAPGDVLPATDPSGGKGFNLAPAYARMLGLTGDAPSTDATVTFDSFPDPTAWGFGQDVVDAITHGISEAGLGRVSGLGVAVDHNNWEPLDLFRYTSAGAYDSTFDSTTTFFSVDGGAHTSASAGLSFNSTKTGGDGEDWRQQDVFGINVGGETLTLTQADIDEMTALGWTFHQQQQVFTAASGDWEAASNWVDGYDPISIQDAALGNGVSATLSASVTVNSISIGGSSTLTIESGGALTATDGTAANPADANVPFFGNQGTIEVGVGASMTLSGLVTNLGAIEIGSPVAVSGDAGILRLSGDTTFEGVGALTLGGLFVSIAPNAAAGGGGGGGHIVTRITTGEIIGAGALINVDNKIAGAGLVAVGRLDNQANASLGATIAGQEMRISTGAISNEGEMFADARTTLGLGASGATTSLGLRGRIDLAADADLAVSGVLTSAGAGVVNLNGAGAELTSDGVAATFSNGTEILATASSQIGDQGLLPANDLTLVNWGAIVAQGAGTNLTLNTGANAIIYRTGSMAAQAGATLTIDSAVIVEPFAPIGAPPPAPVAIEAASGGIVNLNAAVTSVKAGAGEIVIAGGTVNVGAGDPLGVPIRFTGAGGQLNLASTPVDVVIGGAGGAIHLSGARADVTGGGFTVSETGKDSLAIGGNGAQGAADVVNGSGETITTHASSRVSVVGSQDTVNVGVGNNLSLQGANDALSLRTLFGEETFSGFGASDVMDVSVSDFANFQTLLSRTSQSGANTLITLDARDAITLANVAAASLNAAQFHFA